MKFFRTQWRGRFGILLLGIWLIVMGLLPLAQISSSTAQAVVHVLAVAAGVLLLLER